MAQHGADINAIGGNDKTALDGWVYNRLGDDINTKLLPELADHKSNGVDDVLESNWTMIKFFVENGGRLNTYEYLATPSGEMVRAEKPITSADNTTYGKLLKRAENEVAKEKMAANQTVLKNG